MPMVTDPVYTYQLGGDIELEVETLKTAPVPCHGSCCCSGCCRTSRCLQTRSGQAEISYSGSARYAKLLLQCH
ncbi:hypothetical protein QW180_25170 [Vibrio sinaloensis]|nr:hypothetical protein [Vibrio sinaloensis]